MKDGIILTEEYFNGMSPSSFHLLNSVSKSFLGVLIGILFHEDILRPEDAVTKHLPELEDTAFCETSIQQALDMTGAVKYDEDYLNPTADFWRETAVVGWRPELAENVPQKRCLSSRFRRIRTGAMEQNSTIERCSRTFWR